jgi:hypothetical protein
MKPSAITPAEAADERDPLPCPFCGNEAVFGEVGGEGHYAGGQFIQCTNDACGASSALIFPLMDDVRGQLLERWNARVGRAAAVPECLRDVTRAAWRKELGNDQDDLAFFERHHEDWRNDLERVRARIAVIEAAIKGLGE